MCEAGLVSCLLGGTDCSRPGPLKPLKRIFTEVRRPSSFAVCLRGEPAARGARGERRTVIPPCKKPFCRTDLLHLDFNKPRGNWGTWELARRLLFNPRFHPPSPSSSLVLYSPPGPLSGGGGAFISSLPGRFPEQGEAKNVTESKKISLFFLHPSGG